MPSNANKPWLFVLHCLLFFALSPAFNATAGTLLDLRTPNSEVMSGESLRVEMRLTNLDPEMRTLDLFLVLEFGDVFYFYPSFSTTPTPLAASLMIPGNYDSDWLEVLNLNIEGAIPQRTEIVWYAAQISYENNEVIDAHVSRVDMALVPSSPSPSPTATPAPSDTATFTPPPATETPSPSWTPTATMPPPTVTPSPNVTMPPDPTPTPMQTGTPTLLPGPGAFDPTYRTSPNFFTQMSRPVDGSGPHGVMQIWYSVNVLPIIGEDNFTVPVGTTVIKEADFDRDGQIDLYENMYKEASGYDTLNNDWRYEVRSGDGQTVQQNGRIRGCINCHAGFPNTDFLGGTGYRD